MRFSARRGIKPPTSYNEDALADEQEEAKQVQPKRRKLGKAATAKKIAKTNKADSDEPDEREPIPKKNKHGVLQFKDHPEFTPNRTPKEVMQAGAFGGTYFRPIYSGVLGSNIRGMHKEFPKDWFEGLDIASQVTSSVYDKSLNKYGSKCGGSLDMWESSGWIVEEDPCGWFQWYCRFYLGRRMYDDERQIKRMLGIAGVKGRFKNQLIGKIARGGTTIDDTSISPVIRQVLLHWGYELTQIDADKYIKLKSLPSIEPVDEAKPNKTTKKKTKKKTVKKKSTKKKSTKKKK